MVIFSAEMVILFSNTVYCLYSMLFRRNKQTNLVKEGLNCWKNGQAKIIIPETLEVHIMASIKVAYSEACFPLLPTIKENVVSNVLLN